MTPLPGKLQPCSPRPVGKLGCLPYGSNSNVYILKEISFPLIWLCPDAVWSLSLQFLFSGLWVLTCSGSPFSALCLEAVGNNSLARDTVHNLIFPRSTFTITLSVPFV